MEKLKGKAGGLITKLTVKEISSIAFTHFGGTTFKSGLAKAQVVQELTNLIRQQPTVLGLGDVIASARAAAPEAAPIDATPVLAR